jgi:hypothetical protein
VRATSSRRGIALFGLLLHLVTINSYGWFRDELYYVACGEHLAWARTACRSTSAAG